jgi:hypothetical protein
VSFAGAPLLQPGDAARLKPGPSAGAGGRHGHAG